MAAAHDDFVPRLTSDLSASRSAVAINLRRVSARAWSDQFEVDLVDRILSSLVPLASCRYQGSTIMLLSSADLTLQITSSMSLTIRMLESQRDWSGELRSQSCRTSPRAEFSSPAYGVQSLSSGLLAEICMHKVGQAQFTQRTELQNGRSIWLPCNIHKQMVSLSLS